MTMAWWRSRSSRAVGRRDRRTPRPIRQSRRSEVMIMALFSYRAFDELEEQVAAAGRDGQIADPVNHQERGATDGDALAKRAVALGLASDAMRSQSREHDAAAGLTASTAKAVARWLLPVPGGPRRRTADAHKFTARSRRASRCPTTRHGRTGPSRRCEPPSSTCSHTRRGRWDWSCARSVWPERG